MWANIEWFAGGAVVVAAIVAIVSSITRGWVPVSDHALLELAVRDVPGHLPLVGVWSRFGWNHPGPAQFYFLSVFYWLGGRHSEMLLVGTVGMNVLFGAIAWRCAKGICALSGGLVLVGSLLLFVTAPAVVLRDPWNPNVVTLGGLTLCCCAWSFAERHRAGSLAMAPVASFLVQAHLVTAPFVAVVVLVAVCCFLAARRVSIPWRDVLAGAFLALVMWIPPLWQQFTGSPGNLVAILQTTAKGPAVGLASTARIMSKALGPVPDVLNPRSVAKVTLPTTSWAVPIWFVAFLLAVIVVVRRRDWTLARGAVVAAAGLIGSALAIEQITGGAFNYLAIARRSAVVFVFVILVHAVLATSQSWKVRGTKVSYVVAVPLALAIAGLQIVAENPLEPYASTVKDFARVIQQDHLPRDIAVDSNTLSLYSLEVSPALVLALERRGYQPVPIRLDASQARAHRLERHYSYVVKVSPPDLENDLKAEGWEILAVHQPFSASEIARLSALARATEANSKEPDPQVRERRQRSINEKVDRIRRGRIDLLLAGRPASG